VRFPDRDRSRLVIVGPSDYDHSALENLPAAANCSKRLRAVLAGGDSGGFRPEHCLVSDGNIAPQQLADQIHRFAAAAGDVLALWLIGHGLLDVDNRKLHFALKATDPEDLYYTALPFDRLKRAIRDSPAEIKVLMLDCCFSGRVITEMAMSGSVGLEEVVSAEVAVEGTYIVTACSGRDIAIAPPGGQHTAFTGAMLEVLQERAPIVMGDMVRQGARLLKNRSLPRPQFAASDTASDLALVRESVSARPEFDRGGLQIKVAPPQPKGAPADEGRPATATAAVQGATMQRVDRQPGGQAIIVDDADARELGMLQLHADAEEEARDDKGLGPEVVIAALRKIITDMIPVGGSTHPLTLAARDLYGFWLSRAARYDDSIRQFSRLAQARAQILGPEHPSALASRHNLAHVVGLAGNTSGAVSQFAAVAEDRKRILGDRHPDTLLSIDGLAHWTAVSGNTSRALVMYEALLEEEDWHSGPGDKRTLEWLSQLAWVRGLGGDAAGARDSYADLAERWESLEGAQSAQARKYAEFRNQWAARAQSGD
jgi:hypothetical protein